METRNLKTIKKKLLIFFLKNKKKTPRREEKEVDLKFPKYEIIHHIPNIERSHISTITIGLPPTPNSFTSNRPTLPKSQVS